MSETHDLTAVEALLEERDAVAGWLARLDAQGAAAPETVRDRVRRDYRDRLDGLTDRLREHADAVGSRLADDRAEHDALMERARSAREALAEAELRHGVGEYDDDRFEAERSRHMADLDTLEHGLGTVGDRIARLEEVHDLVTAPAGARSGRAAAPVAPEEPATLPPEQRPWPEEGPPQPEPEPEPEPEQAARDSEPNLAADDTAMEITDLAPSDDDTETDDLLSIFDQDDGPDDEEDDVRPGTPGFGPLSFTPSGPDPVGPPKPAPPPLGMPAPEQSPRFVRPGRGSGGRSDPVGVQRAEAIRVIPDPEPILPDVPADTGGDVIARTLRCGECGAMNRPLEWYCEKCGAELSAV